MKKTNFFRLTTLLLSMMFVNLVNLNADSAGSGSTFIECSSGSTALEQVINDNHKDVVCCGKKYIPLEKIALVDRSILVEIEGEVFETPSIYSDENGFYIENVKIADQGNCSHLQWQCPNPKCKACNSLFYSCCSECNTHISGNRKCK